MSDRAIAVEECWAIDKTLKSDELSGEKRFVRVRLHQEFYNLSLLEARALHRELGRMIRSAQIGERQALVAAPGTT